MRSWIVVVTGADRYDVYGPMTEREAQHCAEEAQKLYDAGGAGFSVSEYQLDGGKHDLMADAESYR